MPGAADSDRRSCEEHRGRRCLQRELEGRARGAAGDFRIADTAGILAAGSGDVCSVAQAAFVFGDP
jgi:hypothetical protein